MAIRSTIKSLLKRFLQGKPTSHTETKSTSYDHFPSQSTNTPTATKKEVAAEKSSIDSLQSPVVSTVVDTSTKKEAPNQPTAPPTEPVSKLPQSLPAQIDTSGASFVFSVQNLFPETCPHCNNPSYGNWTRIENKFACASCETAY